MVGHFPNFGGKKFFSGKSSSLTHNVIWISSIMLNLEKTNDTTPRKYPDRWKNGQKDGQTLFHRTLPANAGDPTSLVSEVTSRRKEEYQNHIALKLNDPMTTTKTYWSILKTCNGKKVPIIPPILINKLISDSKMKANHYNNFIGSHCTPLDNSSKIPENQTYITNTKLSLIKFENKDIINIIRSLSVGKTHGHDVSI